MKTIALESSLRTLRNDLAARRAAVQRSLALLAKPDSGYGIEHLSLIAVHDRLISIVDAKLFEQSLSEGDVLNRLEDLHKQATVERSHYYVGKVVTEAIAEIKRLRERK